MQMADEPRRKHSSLGMPLPAPHKGLPSEGPPPEGWFQLIYESQRKLEATVTAQLKLHGERLDRLDEEIRQLREAATIGREVRQELREQGHLLADLASDVRGVMRSDATQTVDLGKLEARVIAAVAPRTEAIATATATVASHEEATRVSRKWGWPALALAALSLVATVVKTCGPAIVDSINK